MELLITPRSICQTEFLSRVCKFKKENRRLMSGVLHETKLAEDRSPHAVTPRGMYQNCAVRAKL